MRSKLKSPLRLLIFFALLLSACQRSPIIQNEAATNTSSSSKLSDLSSSNSNTFSCTPQGCLGTVQVQGYAQIESRTPDPDFEQCGQNCKSYRYISLHVTDGMTDDVIRTVSDRELIGIGCPEDNSTIISDISTVGNYTTQIRMDEIYASMILESSATHPVSVTLARNYEPPGGDAPHCYTFFRVASVSQF